jgi:hypothetical protein
MLDGKNFVCRNLYGEYIDKNPYGQGYDMEKASKGLSADGKRMITNFINQNIKREKDLRKKEKLLYEEIIDHKTPKNERPFWKSGLHVMEHFGPPLIDKCYKFKAPPILKYDLNQPPFRRPKKEGDYFDKDIHRLGGIES